MSNDKKTDDNERFTTSDEEFQTQTADMTNDPDSPLSDGKKSEIDKGREKKKSNNHNKILFGCLGLAIAGYLGYVFFLKPTPIQAPPPRPIGAVNNPVQQVPQTPQVQAPVQQLPQVQPQASNLPNLNAGATVTPNPVPSNVPPVSQTPITPTTTPSVVVQTTPPVLESNVSSVEDEDTVSRKEYDDLKNQVEKLEVKLNDMSMKLASTAEAHSEYVAKFDRFVNVFGEKLDARFAEYDKKISELVDRMTELEKQLEEKKAPPKPAARPNPAPRPQAAKPTPKANPDVLIDRDGDAKVSVPKANVTVAPKPIVAVKAENSLPVAAKEVKLPSLNVHALVDGRFWIKKTDGTIESYKVGDKLPTGEVINEVYKKKDGNYIVTDKRTISD